MYIKVGICKLTIDYQYIECLTFASNFENLNLHWIWLHYKCYISFNFTNWNKLGAYLNCNWKHEITQNLFNLRSHIILFHILLTILWSQIFNCRNGESHCSTYIYTDIPCNKTCSHLSTFNLLWKFIHVYPTKRNSKAALSSSWRLINAV